MPAALAMSETARHSESVAEIQRFVRRLVRRFVRLQFAVFI